MSRTLPPLLEPYLHLAFSSSSSSSLSSSSLTSSPPYKPDEAEENEEAGQDLVVLTGILGASTNWLVLRYLYSFLGRSPSSSTSGIGTSIGTSISSGISSGISTGSRVQTGNGNGNGKEEKAKPVVVVLLVSFLRDFAFWRDSASRMGLDLEVAGRKGRFGFVDGLSGLFSSSSSPSQGLGQGTSSMVISGSGSGFGSSSLVRPIGLGGVGANLRAGEQQQQRTGVQGRVQTQAQAPRGIPGRAQPQPSSPSKSSSPQSAATSAPAPKRWTLTSPKADDVAKTLRAAVDEMKAQARGSRVVLVVDGLDFLVAAGGESNAGQAVREMLLELREVRFTFFPFSPSLFATSLAILTIFTSLVLALAFGQS